MASLASLRGLRPTLTSLASTSPSTASRALSTSAPLAARKVTSSSGGGTPEYAGRVANLRQHLFAQARPLCRQQREARERELSRMQQSMYAANEELRRSAGPGTRDEGWLYRVSQEKKGVYGPGAVPIEYARQQTETPARQAWNHEWKR
ncbi:RING finger domain protein [Colletotrichum higginsianum]|nr:RING finger domain protein [Colletotrichum higginsianum]